MSSERRRLTSATELRALSHPTRLALLELLDTEGPLTATEAGERLGESPANCSFHLRTLAKYGYIEEAGGGRGRERPWTQTHRIIAISSKDQEPQAAVAAKSLSRLWHDLILDRIRRAFTAGAWPDGWEHTPQSSTHVVYLTPEETAQVAQAMNEVLDRYNYRRAGADPSLRPAGALPVEFSFFGYPRTDLAAVESKETGK